MSDVITWIGANGEALVTAATSLIAFCSLVANFTKTDADNKFIAVLANIIHFIALNFTVNKAPVSGVVPASESDSKE